jgi:uncharacterized membrane protein
MQRLIAVNLKDSFFGENAIGDYANADGGFGQLISAILPTTLVIAAFILFIYMIVGGFMIISSSGDAKKADEGKQALTNAIIGFVIIFTSYWIIQIIEIITGISIVN